jgi:hypothetical protein
MPRTRNDPPRGGRIATRRAEISNGTAVPAAPEEGEDGAVEGWDGSTPAVGDDADARGPGVVSVVDVHDATKAAATIVAHTGRGRRRRRIVGPTLRAPSPPRARPEGGLVP